VKVFLIILAVLVLIVLASVVLGRRSGTSRDAADTRREQQTDAAMEGRRDGRNL
jgi:hypothetical protein